VLWPDIQPSTAAISILKDTGDKPARSSDDWITLVDLLLGDVSLNVDESVNDFVLLTSVIWTVEFVQGVQTLPNITN
jgi:hypothetical protein